MGIEVARSVMKKRPIPQGRQSHARSHPQSHLIPTARCLSILERSKAHKVTLALLVTPFLG